MGDASKLEDQALPEALPVIVVVGMRGAGKSTLIDACRADPLFCPLKPMTTRRRRTPDDEEYHFVAREAWPHGGMLWQFEADGDLYGMSRAELAPLAEGGRVGIGQYYLAAMDTFDADVRRPNPGYRFFVVGLDTLETAAQQVERVGAASGRFDTAEAFVGRRAMFERCDWVLDGALDAAAIRAAVRHRAQELLRTRR